MCLPNTMQSANNCPRVKTCKHQPYPHANIKTGIHTYTYCIKIGKKFDLLKAEMDASRVKREELMSSNKQRYLKTGTGDMGVPSQGSKKHDYLDEAGAMSRWLAWKGSEYLALQYENAKVCGTRVN